MNFVYVAGAWGSGTSALAGALTHMGCFPGRRTLVVNDKSTGNTFENMMLYELMKTLFKFEDTVSFTQIAASFSEAQLRDFVLSALKKVRSTMEQESPSYHGVIKMPWLGIFTPQVMEAFYNPKVIVVTRPIYQIEEGNNRRGWAKAFGSWGASRIYRELFSDLREYEASFLTVSYADLVNDTTRTLNRVCNFTGLMPSPAEWDGAYGFIRKG